MNIIFVSNSMSKPRVFTTTQVLLFLVLLVFVIAEITATLIVPQAGTKQQGVRSILPSALHLPIFNTQAHLDALALQVGEIQARVMRLDALSERLSKFACVQDADAAVKHGPPGQGGPEIRAHGLTEAQLQQKIAELTGEVESRTDQLSQIEAMLLTRSIQKNALPTKSPVQGAYNSSSYGWRIDPFTGHSAFHEGLDFTAEIGTPIYAAAGGIVMSAETTPDYGKIVKIDHGSGLETRYAHASKLLVAVGERVEKGQLIAEVGSTGRSTGAHLHFEVRLNGEALDPRKYLQKNVLAESAK